MTIEIASQVVWILATLIVYWVALTVYRRSGASPLLHPLIIATVCIFLMVSFSSTEVTDYQRSTFVLDWLLGPATVALALPLYRQIRVVRNLGIRVIIPILCGGVLAPLIAWLTLFLLTDNVALQMTMLVKSITTPFAIEVAEVTNGIPALAAGIVIVTGIVGAISSPYVFAVLNIRSEAAKGIALGTIAHAIGTARALHMGETTAALATLALCVNGIVTAFVIPLLFAS